MNQLQTLERLAGLQCELTGQAQACLGLLLKEQLEPLLDLMERRRLLFSQVMALHQDLQQSQPSLEQTLASLPASQETQAQDLLRSIREQSGRMQEMDRQSADLLGAILERMRGELARLGQGQRLLNAYRTLPTGVRYGPDQLSRTL